MGKPSGFVEFPRRTHGDEPVDERVRHWREFLRPLDADELRRQGARCMDCGVPFCHSGFGCPLANRIPDFNDLLWRGRWAEALAVIESTNNFPEFTGRLCPAICETACVLGVAEPPVAVRENELAIVERAFAEGRVTPRPPERRTEKKIAVVGSGPAGLAAAQQLNRAGHLVTVFERSDRIGGLLRYGIPDFKLEKRLIDRRLRIMDEEGVVFRPGAHVGVDVPAVELRKGFDSVLLAGGSTHPRDLAVPGRELAGVHFAMDFLSQQNRRNAGDTIPAEKSISAEGKRVVVLGGGDTGSDCVGTSIRQGARSVTQIELLPMPPDVRAASNPWPQWPRIMRTSSSHEEGCERLWSIATKAFDGDAGRLSRIRAARLSWDAGGKPAEIPGSEFVIDVDLALLALGFLHTEHGRMLSDLGVALDDRGNVKTDGAMMTSAPGVFAAGDMRRGQSLVVWAISEGRSAARNMDQFLMGHSDLPEGTV
jgi:glutamate synthase (NADPH) small chain